VNSELVGGRPRRWWVALLLNQFVPPAGYAYVRAWRWVGVLLVVELAACIGLIAWTFANPPGVYPLESLLPWAVPINLSLALHAAWLSRRAPAVTGARWKHAVGYLALGALFILLVPGAVRAFWPQSIYSFASSSMAPSVAEGDIIGINGARAFCGGVRPAVGDLVLYRQPKKGAVRYLHRLVAGPGDTVAMRKGRLILNDAEVKTEGGALGVLVETLPNGVRHKILDMGADGPFDDMAPVRLGADMWYVLGDSRDNALDSRFNGPLPSRDICGVGAVVLLSKDKSRVGLKP
jgi:signal peptidase I